jgi:hypothetical protein
VRIDWLALCLVLPRHDVSNRWFIGTGPDGLLAVRAYRASDETQVHPERLQDLIAPPGPDYRYELRDCDPLNLGYDNLRHIWPWEVPRLMELPKCEP